MNTYFLTVAKHFNQGYKTSFSKCSKEYKLTQLDIDVLLFLRNNPINNTAQDIVEYRYLAKSNVSKSIENLRKLGYITSKTDESNRRIQRLFLNEDKLKIIDELLECQTAFFSNLKEEFTQDDIDKIIEYAQRIDEKTKNIIKENIGD